MMRGYHNKSFHDEKFEIVASVMLLALVIFATLFTFVTALPEFVHSLGKPFMFFLLIFIALVGVLIIVLFNLNKGSKL